MLKKFDMDPGAGIVIAIKGIGIRAIARKLGRPPSTISREVRRNAATRSGNLDYRPVPPNGTPIVSPGGLLASWRSIRLCVNMLRSAWPAKSPIPMAPHSRAPRWVWKNDRAGGGRQPGAPSRSLNRLQIDYPEDQTMRISHETIYQSLYIQGRGALRRGLTACLRSRRALRVPRERARVRNKSFIGDALIISDRPGEIADRAVPGHWEGDLILGLGS